MGVSQVGSDTGRSVTLVAFVVSLVLEEDELKSFVIGTVVPKVRHQ